MPILFLHIPKAAGTYVDSCVRQAKIKSAHAVSTEEELTNAFLGKRQYIAGHFTIDTLSLVKASYSDYKLVTVVRNPIDRFISDINYHIEILKRGKRFLEKHSDDWQRLISSTYRSLQNIQAGEEADFTHLYKIMLNEYLASRLLSKEDYSEVKKNDVNTAVRLLSKMLSCFSYIGIVERGGADSLMQFVSSELSVDFTLYKPNPNSSINYVSFPLVSPEIQKHLQRSNVSNLIYLMLTDRLPSDLENASWEHINDIASELYISDSLYKTKAELQLPCIAMDGKAE